MPTHRTRRTTPWNRPTVGGLLTIVPLILTLVTACGGDGDGDGEPAGGNGGSAGSGTTDEATDATGGPTAGTVETVDGPVEIPETVERVVTVHNIATQPVIELGIEPVGIGGVTENAVTPGYWAEVEDIDQVSAAGQVNVEMVGQLEPDLIFSTNAVPDDVHRHLEEIAPVVVIGIRGPQRADWQGRAELVAEVTGRTAELAELENDFDDRIEQIATDHSDVLDEHTFNVLDSYEAGTVIPYSPDSMVGRILEPAGARFAPSATSDIVRSSEDDPSYTISFEQLPAVTDGTVILHGSRASDNEPSGDQRALIESPLLQSSPAGEAGHVHPIGKTTIAGYGDAQSLLDHFEEALVELAG